MSLPTDPIELLTKAVRSDCDSRHLSRCLLHEFRGAEGMAKEVKHTYDTLPDGHANRVRLLSDALRFVAMYGGHDDDDTEDADQIRARLMVELQAENLNSPDDDDGDPKEATL